MNTIKIKVRKFGPLENVVFEMAPLMILTGKSNLGKSYANYLIYYLMSFLVETHLRKHLENLLTDTDFTAELTTKEMEKELHKQAKPFMQSFLGYESVECDVEFELPEREYKIAGKMHDVELGPDVTNRFLKISVKNLWAYDFPIGNVTFIASRMCRDISKDILGLDLEGAMMLPPGKCSLAGSNFSMKKGVSAGMKMYEDFLRDYDYNKAIQADTSRQHIKSANDIFTTLLDGDLVVDKDQEFLSGDDKQIPLSAAASSIKELSSLLFYVKNHFSNKAAICLEEPEAHLHPELQIKVADSVAVGINNGLTFNITTHSDYFLQRINQLIKLGDLKAKDEKTYEKFIHKYNLMSESYIDRANVKSYYFKKENGKVVVVDTKLNENGIQYTSFSDAVNILQKMEDDLSDAYYEIEESND